ncbi:hypothetical protein AX17_000042 [Amanita inopinata Kibby_2008]|nr:hypothetical protein AX17_000042 [Amanita inopinata Kibby_2008]
MTSLFFVLFFAVVVLANTEIVNFATADSFPPLPFSAASPSWPILSQTYPEHRFNITAAPSLSLCNDDDQHSPYHVWAVLEMTNSKWSSYSKYTLRISWPAMFPTEFSIKLYSSASDPRVKYARVRAVFDGVFTPANTGTHPFLPYRTASDDTQWDTVPFFLILEPLYFGILPESVFPALLAIVAVSFVAYKFVALPVDRYLQKLAEQAKKEIISGDGKKAE